MNNKSKNSITAIKLTRNFAVITLKASFNSINLVFLTLIKLKSIYKYSSVVYVLILLEIHGAVVSVKAIFAKFASVNH